LPIQYQDATNTVVAPYGTITATNVQNALEQLADQDFRSTSTPTGTNVSEGDTWYDLDDNIMKVYREISSGVFAWTNLVVAETNDTLDAGAF
jgi:protein involved in temperature-dependent protein secretion